MLMTFDFYVIFFINFRFSICLHIVVIAKFFDSLPWQPPKACALYEIMTMPKAISKDNHTPKSLFHTLCLGAALMGMGGFAHNAMAVERVVVKKTTQPASLLSLRQAQSS